MHNTIADVLSTAKDKFDAGRIWWVHRRTQGRVGSGPNLTSPMILVVESGAIYCAAIFILIGLFVINNPAQIIIADAVSGQCIKIYV